MSDAFRTDEAKAAACRGFLLPPASAQPDATRRAGLLAGLSALAPVAPLAWLAGCAQNPRSEPASTATSPSASASASAAADGWQEVRLPGKAPTHYHWEHKAGRRALAARAQRSASLWRRRLAVAPEHIGEVAFSWWVESLIDGADLAQADRADAPARVVFGFDGDHSRLSAKNRMLFDLAEALTGEPPPFATLMYVWDNRAPVGSVIPSARTDRVRKLVVDSGPSQLERWRDHRRSLAADFRTAYGEAPGRLLSVALMTDADNTGRSARAWYGPVRLL